MSIRKKAKTQRVLSRSMTMSDLEEWFEAEFAKIRRRRGPKRPRKSSTTSQPKKDQENV